jgi:hypothetical protein
MKMAENLRFSLVKLEDPCLVRFETECGRVCGIAYCREGSFETSYHFVDAKVLIEQQEGVGPRRPSMLQRKAAPGVFTVIGQVTRIFDDEVTFIVEAYGFDFWVNIEDIHQLLEIGDWLQLELSEFTLWVGCAIAFGPVCQPAIVLAKVKCEQCGTWVTVPVLDENGRSRAAKLIRSGSLPDAIQALRIGPCLPLERAKLLAEHITPIQGVCKQCGNALPDTSLSPQGMVPSPESVVHCPACKSLNLDW